MKSIILAFAGGIGSGKSKLSLEVASILGWQRLSFGDYIRNYALQYGLDQSREMLQQLGENLIAKLGWEKFCKDFLEKGNRVGDQSLIVDGIRHIEVLEALKKILSPNKILLVFISLPFEERFSRVAERDKIEKSNLRKYDSHSTEVQINSSLFKVADLIIDGSRPVKELTGEIISWIHQYQ